MKECLFCKKYFNPKKAHAKFCSDKCRVYFNRTKPKKVKGLSLEDKIDFIFNKMVELEENPKVEIKNDYSNVVKGVGYYLEKLKKIDFTSWEETQEFEKEVSSDIFLNVGEKALIRKEASLYN
jgi:hypothetical protein